MHEISSDESLVRRARGGDEEAFRELFDRWLPRLRSRSRRALRGILRRRVAESDMVQEAYLTAYLRLSDFEDRGEGSFGRWLARILDNKLREQVRGNLGAEKRDLRREVTQPEGGRESFLPNRGPTPSAEMIGVERQEALARALAALPDDYQTVLRLVHTERIPLAEVGLRTGRSANAACKIYGRAVAELGRVLGRERMIG